MTGEKEAGQGGKHGCGSPGFATMSVRYGGWGRLAVRRHAVALRRRLDRRRDHRRVMSTRIGPSAAFTLLFVSCATTSSTSASEAPSRVALPSLAVIGTMNSPFFFLLVSGG